MPHLICYDIEGDYLRTKIGNLILDYGFDRINLSVYLGTIERSSLTALEGEIEKMIAGKGKESDSVLVLQITALQVHEMKVIGKNDLDKGELSGEKSTLII